VQLKNRSAAPRLAGEKWASAPTWRCLPPHALATLCLVEVSPTQAPSSHGIPTPRDAIAPLLHRADITLPKAFSLSGTRMSTKKKLQ